MKLLDIQAGHCTRLPGGGGMPDAVHLFEKHQIQAINAAIAALLLFVQRPVMQAIGFWWSPGAPFAPSESSMVAGLGA